MIRPLKNFELNFCSHTATPLSVWLQSAMLVWTLFVQVSVLLFVGCYISHFSMNLSIIKKYYADNWYQVFTLSLQFILCFVYNARVKNEKHQWRGLQQYLSILHPMKQCHYPPVKCQWKPGSGKSWRLLAFAGETVPSFWLSAPNPNSESLSGKKNDWLYL